ncbi:MAG: hypothetical protein HRT56_03025 [Coraliomargarita sp.]|nr:hypothetical protein [Coraliomargarita sp.]
MKVKILKHGSVSMTYD